MKCDHDTYTRDMFDPRMLARTNNPETSRAAARRVREFGEHHHGVILDVLRAYPRGLTVHEIAAHCRLTAHEVGKRIAELDRAERIDPVLRPDGRGTLTRSTPSGRQARVWTIRNAGAA